MPSLKEIRTRLASVKSTRQITNAMKMVSAAKLRKTQDAILQMRPFSKKLKEIYQIASEAQEENAQNIFFQPNTSDRILIIVISSNRGLCGAFNSNVVKKCLSFISEKRESGFNENNIDIFCIGKKGYDGLKNKNVKIIDTNNTIFDHLTFENTRKIADQLINNFLNKKYSSIELIYNQFRNAVMQDVVIDRFLPVIFEKPPEELFEEKYYYIHEPSVDTLLNILIPVSLRIQFHKALLDSYTSEHGARMTAMHKATDNATELIGDLELTYNKARQSSITKELLEIVSGANALKG
jgi:F-type H+-transporting ATPase subunit gamma